jgi:hypothetical protein
MEKWGTVTSVTDNIITVKMNDKAPKKGDVVRVRWGKIRSVEQNAFYWTFLTWLISEGGLDQYLTPEELHDDLKGHFLMVKTTSDKGILVIKEKSTTELSKVEFGNYLDKIDKLMNTFFGISTAQFWSEYAQQKGGL